MRPAKIEDTKYPIKMISEVLEVPLFEELPIIFQKEGSTTTGRFYVQYLLE